MLDGTIYHGLPEGLPIISNAAPRYLIWDSSALCWIHEEREDVERVRSQIWEPWELYERLKAYAKSPSQTERQKLTGLFNATFNRHGATCRMNKLLQNTLSRKKGLLQAPHVPLHNNDCERDIREYVKKRKISASTRSNSGRRARDTFLSFKKTCAKRKSIFSRI